MLSQRHKDTKTRRHEEEKKIKSHERLLYLCVFVRGFLLFLPCLHENLERDAHPHASRRPDGHRARSAHPTRWREAPGFSPFLQRFISLSFGSERRLTAAGRQAAGGPGCGFGAVLAKTFTGSPCGNASQDAPLPPSGTRFCHFPPGDPFLDYEPPPPARAARRAIPRPPDQPEGT